jgi:hypothetical protein
MRISDLEHPVWLKFDELLGESKRTEARKKVETFEGTYELERSEAVPATFEGRAKFYACRLRCPVAVYPIEGYGPGEWAGILFYEVEDEKPRPDTDLLLGFPDSDGARFIITRRGADQIRSDSAIN